MLSKSQAIRVYQSAVSKVEFGFGLHESNKCPPGSRIEPRMEVHEPKRRLTRHDIEPQVP